MQMQIQIHKANFKRASENRMVSRMPKVCLDKLQILSISRTRSRAREKDKDKNKDKDKDKNKDKTKTKRMIKKIERESEKVRAILFLIRTGQNEKSANHTVQKRAE